MWHNSEIHVPCTYMEQKYVPIITVPNSAQTLIWNKMSWQLRGNHLNGTCKIFHKFISKTHTLDCVSAKVALAHTNPFYGIVNAHCIYVVVYSRSIQASVCFVLSMKRDMVDLEV